MFSFKQKSLFSVRVPILMRKCAFKAWKSDFSCCFSVREHLVKSQLFWKVFSLPKATFLYQKRLFSTKCTFSGRKRCIFYEGAFAVEKRCMVYMTIHSAPGIDTNRAPYNVTSCTTVPSRKRSRACYAALTDRKFQNQTLIALRSKPFFVCVKRKQVF